MLHSFEHALNLGPAHTCPSVVINLPIVRQFGPNNVEHGQETCQPLLVFRAQHQVTANHAQIVSKPMGLDKEFRVEVRVEGKLVVDHGWPRLAGCTQQIRIARQFSQGAIGIAHPPVERD